MTGPAPRALVIDDQASVRATISIVLKNKGFEVVAVEAEADHLLPGEVLGEALSERVCILVDHRDRVAAALQAQGELAPHTPTTDYDDVHG